MLVSEIIAKAKEGIVQGDTDPMWSDDEWLDAFHEAQDMVAAQLCDADLPFYLVRDAEITASGGIYPLPATCRSVREVRSGDDENEIYPHDENDEEESASFEIENENIRLLHWTGDQPTKLIINYRSFPDDDLALTDTPQFPLNGKRGGRILARVIRMLAKVKDESATEEELSAIKIIIDNFVDRMGSMYDKDAYFQ